MAVRISKLFGMDIYSVDGEYKGRVFDLIINLEKGKIETITTEALKPRTRQEAKRILSEKSIQYKRVKSAKDILVIGDMPIKSAEEEGEAPQHHRPTYTRAPTRRATADQLRYRH